MWRILSLLQKNLVWAIPISMAFGLLFGYLFDARPLKQFIIPVTFFMVYPMMVTLNVKTVFKGHDLKLQFITQVINFVLIPLLAFYMGKIFFSGGPEKYGLWAVGLFLIGVLPTSGMTISWTGFAKGNKEAAIKMVVFGLVLGALAAPVYTKVFMGATIDVNMLHMFKQIALFVFVPLFAGLLTQYFAQKKYGTQTWNQRIKPKFPPFSALGVIMIAFVAMSLKAKHIIANPGDILSILIPLTVFYIITYALLSVTGKLFFRREDAIAMVFGVVMRDLSIALAIAMTAFGKEGLTIALLIALAYVIQIQSAAWYVRLVERIFGSRPATAVPAHLQKAGATASVDSSFQNITPNGDTMLPDLHRILYATDLSQTARYAVRYACSIGNKYEAEVNILHVVPDALEEFYSGAGIDLGEYMTEEMKSGLNEKNIEKAREAIRQRIQETSQKVIREIPSCPLAKDNIMVEIGDPADRIVKTASDGKYDMVIMGTHGHSKLDDIMLGSVARDVVHNSSVPVLTVRLPEEPPNAQMQSAA